jgi:hypothetical protein
MSEKTNAAPAVVSEKRARANEGRAIILKEIGAKWGKFEEDLVSQIVAKYSLEKASVQRDVDTLLKGRHL